MSKLPSTSIVHGLLDVFFSEANWYFGAIDRLYFDRAHRTWSQTWDDSPNAVEQHVNAESLHFPALLCQILALGTQFVPPGSPVEAALQGTNLRSLDELSNYFSERGEKILNTLGRHLQAITAVQADLMRCAWLKNDGRGAEAWYSLGNAVR